MIPDIKITTLNSCELYIEDLTDYIDEDSTAGESIDGYKYSDSVSIDVLLRCKTDGAVYLTPVFTSHDDFEDKTITIPITFDGCFKVYHMIVPTKEWFSKYGSIFTTGGYYSDGEYLYNFDDEKVDIDLIVETEETSIFEVCKEYVSICYLLKCYIDLCQQIFNSKAFTSCWNTNNVDSELTYKRDLVWMAINVIKYLVELEQLIEAERYIEILENCNGICNSNSSSNSNTQSCGCNR